MARTNNLFKNLKENQAIRLILEGTAADVGERFFKSLVENLTNVLKTRGAWVTEYNEEKRQLISLAFILDGQLINNFAYDISGTACEKVIEDKQLVHIPDRLLELYKGNPSLVEFEYILKTFKATSYLGVPLTDADDNILGHLSLIDTRSIPDHPQVINIFRIFANRASAELQRLKAEKKVNQSEEKFRKLFDSAMDAIIEISRDRKITRINPSGEKLFKTSSEKVLGKNISGFIGKVNHEKIDMLFKTLENLPKEQRYLWIPGGLKAKASDGDVFPAEGTLSKFRIGVDDYFTLILRNEKERIEAEQKIQSMAVESEYLRAEIRNLGNYDKIIGDSEPLIRVLKNVGQVSKTDSTVLILGETGTGKEAIARAIHASSHRNSKPLITVNCTTIPATLIESEFFGHEKGAFTGATLKRHGRFALADKGTIFLDEIGELPTDLQVRLLRVLQEGTFEPVGSSKSISVDVRVIAATNRDLAQEIEKGNFREDLYYRLNVFPIDLPPLRERGEDIIKLATYFINKFCKKMGSATKSLKQQDLQLLKAYHWPGNVRELQNVIERAVIISQGRQIDLQGLITLSNKKEQNDDHNPPVRKSAQFLTEKDLKQIERDNLLAALKATGWRVSGGKGAARLLRMNPSTFASRMKKLGINRP